MIPLLKIAGWGMVLLGLVHAFFPRYFQWKSELPRLSLINRQMAEVHMFFVALTVCLMGLLCITSADLLLTTTLGQRVSLGFAIFWGTRLVIQFAWYSPELWRGKPFETAIHVGFAFLWLCMTLLFLWAAGVFG